MTLILQTFSSNSHTHFQWLFSRCHCSVLAWTSFPGLLLFCGLLYIPTHSSLENGTSLFGKGKWPSYPYIFKSQSLIPKLFSWRLFSFMKCSNVCSVLTFFSCSVLPSWQEKQRTALKHSWDFYPTILSAAAAAKLLQSCPTLRPHRRKPTRLPCPWDSPGKNTGVGCHFLLQCMKVKSEREVAQSCPTRSDPMDCSLPGSSVHGIFQGRVLEWGATAFSNHTH